MKRSAMLGHLWPDYFHSTLLAKESVWNLSCCLLRRYSFCTRDFIQMRWSFRPSTTKYYFSDVFQKVNLENISILTGRWVMRSILYIFNFLIYSAKKLCCTWRLKNILLNLQKLPENRQHNLQRGPSSLTNLVFNECQSDFSPRTWHKIHTSCCHLSWTHPCFGISFHLIVVLYSWSPFQCKICARLTLKVGHLAGTIQYVWSGFTSSSSLEFYSSWLANLQSFHIWIYLKKWNKSY